MDILQLKIWLFLSLCYIIFFVLLFYIGREIRVEGLNHSSQWIRNSYFYKGILTILILIEASVSLIVMKFGINVVFEENIRNTFFFLPQQSMLKG